MPDAESTVTALHAALQALRHRNAELEADAAGHQRVVDALRQSEARFRLLVEQFPLSIQIFAPDGRTVQVNRAWEELWGVTLDQIPDYNVLQDPQLVVQGIMSSIVRGFAGEAVALPPIRYNPNATLPERTRHADPERWVRAFIYPVHDQAGQLREVVLLHEDMTAQWRAEEALRASEARYRTLVEHFPNGAVFLFDQELRYMVAGGSGLAASGLSKEMFEGKTLWEIFPPEIAARDEPVLRAALRGEATRVEVAFGAQTFVVQTVPVTGADGVIVGGMVVTQDITARKQREARQRFLVEASTLLAGSLDYATTLERLAQLAVPDLADWCAVDMRTVDGGVECVAVAHVDPTKVALVREAQRQYPPDATRPHPLLEVLQSGQGAVIPEVPETLLQGIAQDAADLELLKSLGFASWLCAPLVHQERTLGTITFVRSAKERRFTTADLEMAEELARRAALAIANARLYGEAQEAIRTRDTFLAIASHELKTPLTGLLGYLQLLERRLGREHTLSEREQRTLRTMTGQGRRLEALINEMLDIARIEQGLFHVERELLDLGALVRRVVDDLEPVLERHALQLALPAQPLQLQGDGRRLEQVLQNLISNALKYSPAGGAITVRVEERDGAARVEVGDQGIGIPPSDQPHLFERFYRAGNVNPARISGFGLGLYLVKEIVTRHGGTVEVVSREGVGSTFRLTLPLCGPTPC